MNDEDAIRAAALDYIEGWFDGDAGRMDRALHPELVKRCRGIEGDDPDALETLTAREMVDATAEGVGRGEDAEDRQISVEISYLSREIASVTMPLPPLRRPASAGSHARRLEDRERGLAAAITSALRDAYATGQPPAAGPSTKRAQRRPAYLAPRIRLDPDDAGIRACSRPRGPQATGRGGRVSVDLEEGRPRRRESA